ncbi:MAG TPA: orotate phosphoribosyltransferase [Thermoanaerobaculia bacterium]|nr:orotate phosphoribosyltransferase [Thermoanaerobaculia bacterium]
MALDIAALLRETGALQHSHFRLSSGLHSPDYVQCARLLEHPRNAKAIGAELAERVRGLHAARIVAPALGGVIVGYTVADALGVPFAFTERKEGRMTLRRGFRIAAGEPVVIVEDVVTTGKSTKEAAAAVRDAGGRVVGFASILDRSGRQNVFDAPYASLLSMALETYEEGNCPLCAAGIPIDAPGSRHSQ